MVEKSDDPAFMTDGYVASLLAGEDAFFIRNALARLEETEYVILAGLSDKQKSYLELPEKWKIIEIATISEIREKLSPFVRGRTELRCKASDLLAGLFIAQKRQKILLIDETAPALPEVVQLQKAIIVVENLEDDAYPVIAINYANSIGASVLIVDGLPENENYRIRRWIEGWKEGNDSTQLENLRRAVHQRISGLSLTQFEFATFFTMGLPYSLVLENIIPCSYVHLSIRPDLFVFNSILLPDGEHFQAAIVFSPIFFEDEETVWLCNFFDAHKYYLRPLLAKRATVAEFDFHAQHFPYDLLHICSRGGQVDGYEMKDQFTDKDGRTHIVEFDEVVSFTPAPDEPEMFVVQRKVIPQRLDGYGWQSAELQQQNYSSDLILGMWKCALESRGPRKKKNKIAMSCVIGCTDSIHQGQFHSVASQSSPVVFNNTCWSWSDVGAFFLSCGARGYIGTLWAIKNDAAVVGARTFYDNLFSGTVLNALHLATKAISQTASKDIYVFWGLHFTRLPPGLGREMGRAAVRRELMMSVVMWVRKVESSKNVKLRTSAIRVLRSTLRELATNFEGDDVAQLEIEVKDRIPGVSLPETTREDETDVTNVPSMNGALEHRRITEST